MKTREKKDDYDAFIFVTYLYATTLFALPLVKEKSILIPTAHDEVTIYLKLFDKLFAQAREILFLTEKEREFVESRFSRLKQGQIGSEKSSMILSVGVDGPDPQLLEQQLSEILHNESSIQSPSLPTTQGISQAIKDLLKEKTAYLLYLGRIDKNKGCDHLYGCFAYFCWKYKTTRLKLIFAGTQHFFPDPHPNIQILGKVTEEEKWLLLKNAVTTVLPSQFESLSLSVLESFTVGTPVLVNRKCEVLQATIEKSGGGYSFLEAEDFCDRLLELTRDPIESKKGLGEKGRTYVTTHYSWPSAVKTLTKTIERVSH